MGKRIVYTVLRTSNLAVLPGAAAVAAFGLWLALVHEAATRLVQTCHHVPYQLVFVVSAPNVCLLPSATYCRWLNAMLHCCQCLFSVYRLLGFAATGPRPLLPCGATFWLR